jgi:hypothetical protein
MSVSPDHQAGSLAGGKRETAREAPAVTAPADLSARILALQRTAGNQAVARAIHAGASAGRVLQREEAVATCDGCKDLDKLAQAWITPKYRGHITAFYTLNESGQVYMPVFLDRKLKWWKTFATWGMIDLGVPFFWRRSLTSQVEIFVKVYATCEGGVLKAWVEDWSGHAPSRFDLGSARIMRDCGAWWNPLATCTCRLVDVERAPSPAPKSPSGSGEDVVPA